MEFIRKNIQKNYKRNNDISFKLSSSRTSSNGSNITSLSNKLDKAVWDEHFYIDTNNNLHCKKNFASDFGITAFTQGVLDIPTIMDGVVTDETTITKQNGKLTVIGGTGGGVSSWDDLTDKPDWITDSKPTYSWNEIQSKPSTFTPSSHTHSISNITNLQTTLDAKANSSHTHTKSQISDFPTTWDWNNITNKPSSFTPSSHSHSISNITNLQSTLDGKANSSHTHSISNITNLQTELDKKANATYVDDNFVTIATEQNISGTKHFINGYTVGSNNHRIYEDNGVVYIDGDVAITGGITAYAQGERSVSTIMDGVAVDGTTITKENGILKVIGNIGGASNWDELEGKPTWITDTKPTYSWNEIQSKPTTFTPSSHTHSISNITNLQTTLDGKANSSHTHTWDNITNKPTTFTPSSHTHSISNITNLQTTLNGKANSSHTHTWSEITSKPTTISGYNITDAVTTNTLQNIVGQKTFKDVIYQTFISDDYKRAISYVDANKNLIFGDTNANTFLRGKQIKIQNENGVDTLLISNTQVSFNQPIMCNADHITTTGWVQNTTAGKGLYNIEGDARFYFEKTFGGWKADKSILTSGGITCYASDQRAKNIIEDISLSLSDIADAPTVRFKWNNWKVKDDGKTHIGGIAQYTQKILPEAVIESEEMLNMDYATTAYIYAVQTAKHLQDINNKLLSKIEELEKKIIDLNKQ